MSWKVYDKTGNTVRCTLKSLEYNGTWMGACFVTSTLKSAVPILFEIGDYVMYRGEKFEINYDPTALKKAARKTSGEAFVYDNVKFNGAGDELTRCDFLDYVKSDNQIHFTSLPKFSFFASSIQDLADRVQVNLDRIYTGVQKWTVVVHPEYVSTTNVNIDVNNIKVWGALELFNSKFGANFIIRGRTITIGTAGIAADNIFRYGRGNGLYEIQRTADADQQIITRLRAYGSTRNMPNRYYNKVSNSSLANYLPNNMAVENLMLPDFPKTTLDPYIDSKNIAVLGVREGSVYFDGTGDLEEICPSMEGMTAKQLEDAGIHVSLDAGDNGNLDEVFDAEQLTDDGTMDNLKDGEDIPPFTITLKDIGFDINDYLTSETATISMKNGMCGGRDFEITKCEKKGNKYILTCNRIYDEGLKLYFPYKDYNIRGGDKFVLLYIDMPDVYIQAASQRLLAAAKKYLAKNDYVRYSYEPKVDDIFMARQHDEAIARGEVSIHDTLKEGDLMLFTDTDLGIDGSIIIDTLIIKEGEGIIPQYTITLKDEKTVGTLEKIQNQIDSIVSGGQGSGGYNSNQIKSLIKSFGSNFFLSKLISDTANGLITFLKGLLIGRNGSGITVLENGMSQAVVDYLYVKVKAVFDELEVKKKTYVGGEQVISHAGMKCNRVDELDDVYRCYFKEEEDGIEIENQFTPGSLAIAQECNIKAGVSHHVGNRHYWRLVTAVGENYIDLSKTVCDPNVENDVPVAGDDIVGLGHKTDITRQAAIILSSVNEVSPSIIMYQGINDFTLTGKDVISFDFDKSTGKVRMKVYGNTYIGDKDRTTYMEYTQDKGVDIKGMFHIEQGSTGWRNMEGLPDEIQAAADLAQKAQDAIDNAAVGSVNLLRNSGFTGDYESEKLSSDTQLSADTELYSKQLKYWTGVATVSTDSAAGSGYSAAIGSLSQSVSLIKGESYVISYKAKGTSVSVSCGSFSVSQPLTSSYQRYTHKITFNGSGIFLISGTATVCDLQLERGTIATDWKPSILDNDKATAGFQSINYIASAIKDGSVDILGGLILANMIQLGNYKDGKLQKVTAGVSGIYNDDDDVAFWAGGTLQQAILTVMRFRNDPNYQPTDEEWANMANFVATHGGNAFFRGYIYALGGYFRGKVEIANGKILLNEDGSGQLANGNIKWDADGNPEFVGKVKVKSSNGYTISIEPENEYGIPSIEMRDNTNASLIDISCIYGLKGLIPMVSMFDPNSNDVLYFRPDSMVVEQKGSDGYIYQTQIMGGRIIMVKGS
ncbi:hypothetical protein, partial [Phocaeicola vulgatus]|uniref:hypothetical protein n=1 Tax=Phocaeicola vulgatus TaxID=821 RepID=UPI001E320E9C